MFTNILFNRNRDMNYRKGDENAAELSDAASHLGPFCLHRLISSKNEIKDKNHS